MHVTSPFCWFFGYSRFLTIGDYDDQRFAVKLMGVNFP